MLRFENVLGTKNSLIVFFNCGERSLGSLQWTWTTTTIQYCIVEIIFVIFSRLCYFEYTRCVRASIQYKAKVIFVIGSIHFTSISQCAQSFLFNAIFDYTRRQIFQCTQATVRTQRIYQILVILNNKIEVIINMH